MASQSFTLQKMTHFGQKCQFRSDEAGAKNFEKFGVNGHGAMV